MNLRRWIRRLAIGTAGTAIAAALLLTALFLAFPFPVRELERWPTSITVTDRSGATLLRLVGSDDQWREPVDLAEMGGWIASATIAAEDERFYSHAGIDPLAVVRATAQNIAAGRVVSGASTITMQLARMCDPRARTLAAKAVQAFRAVQLEQLFTKQSILEHYLNLAPYGGNIRGIEAAARRYFGKRAADLTLAEAALLAGLPQSPERLRPDRHEDRARDRRNWILNRMRACGSITRSQLDDATAEPVRLAMHPEPSLASHAAWLALGVRPAGGRTSICLPLQTRLEQMAQSQARTLPPGTQVSVAVIDIATGQLVAMVGSAQADEADASQVDGATAYRSPGSALKPFVYATAMESHRLSPDSMLTDVPIQRAGWSPANFSRGFAGEVSAADALRRSLNVPAILVAEGAGLERCVHTIESAGVHFRTNAARRGGLGVVVGAVEVRLLDLTNAYATLGRGGVFRELSLFADVPSHAPLPNEPLPESRVLGPDACAAVSDILSCRHRRPRGMESRPAEDTPWFCWKTGTSSGRRDAWAVGHNTRYAVGVWVGDFSGKGRVQYLGLDAAEPLLGEILTLPDLAAPHDPPPPAPITVTHPLPKPIEAAPSLRITAPSRDAEFLSIRGEAVVPLKCNAPAGVKVQWFVDGLLVQPGAGATVRLKPGRHEVRCVGAGGEVDVVRATVR